MPRPYPPTATMVTLRRRVPAPATQLGLVMQRADQLILDFAQTLGAGAASAARFERFARLLAAMLQNAADDLDARGSIRRFIVCVRTPRVLQIPFEARSINGHARVTGSRHGGGTRAKRYP